MWGDFIKFCRWSCIPRAMLEEQDPTSCKSLHRIRSWSQAVWNCWNYLRKSCSKIEASKFCGLEKFKEGTGIWKHIDSNAYWPNVWFFFWLLQYVGCKNNAFLACYKGSSAQIIFTANMSRKGNKSNYGSLRRSHFLRTDIHIGLLRRRLSSPVLFSHQVRDPLIQLDGWYLWALWRGLSINDSNLTT